MMMRLIPEASRLCALAPSLNFVHFLWAHCSSLLFPFGYCFAYPRTIDSSRSHQCKISRASLFWRRTVLNEKANIKKGAKLSPQLQLGF